MTDTTGMTDHHSPSEQELAMAKAATLVEALPWLERFHGSIVVLKYGGNAMVDDTLKKAFADDVVFLRLAGLRPAVVNGGGPQISTMLDKLGVQSEFRGGYRVTTTEAMDVERRELVGEVGREGDGEMKKRGRVRVG